MTDAPVLMYPPGLPWDTMFQRPHQLMKALAELGYKCVFGQNLHSLTGKPINISAGSYMAPSGVHDNLELCFNCRRYMQDHQDEKVILYASSGKLHAWADFLNPHALIYDELDNFPNWERDAVIASIKADRIIYSAETLGEVVENRRKSYPEIAKATHVPTGGDFAHWNLSYKEPSIPKKVMYVGAFAAWLDFKNILGVVKGLPHYEFWFMGARFDAHPTTRVYVEELLHLPNVNAIQHIPYKFLPMLIAEADALWIPFDVSERQLTLGDFVFPVSWITNYVNPCKFWEYLATGKPIFYTGFDELRRIVTSLKKDYPHLPVWEYDDYVQACRLMTRVLDDEVRGDYTDYSQHSFIDAKAAAGVYTWERSAMIMAGVINDIMDSDLDAEAAERAKLATERNKDPKKRPKFMGIKSPTQPKELL